MRSFVKKSCSVIAASILILSVFSSCNKEPGETGSDETLVTGQTMPSSGQEIEEESLWYDVTTIDFTEKYDELAFDSLSLSYIGVNNERIAVYVFASYNIPQGLDCLRDDLSDYRYETFDIYDINGNLCNSIDVKDIYDTLPGSSGNYAYINSSSFNGETIKVAVSAYDPDDESNSYHILMIDPDTGEVIDDTVTSQGNSVSPERRYDLGEYTVEQYFSWGEYTSYTINVIPDGGEPRDINLNAELSGEDIFDISNIILIGGSRAIGSYTTSDGVPGYIALDLESGSCGIYDEDMSWLGDEGLTNAMNTDDGRVVRIGTSGVVELDFEAHTRSLILDFNNSNVNRYITPSFRIMDVTDESYIFSSYLQIGSDWREFLTVFTRSSVNPNAGKTILRAAAPGGLTYAVAEAVVRFNDESSEGFIIFDESYSTVTGPVVYPHGLYTDIVETDALDREAVVSNELAMDLLTGDGPDLIFGTIGYSQLDSSDYLVDLSGLVSTEGYFENVIDAARTDGSLYQIPLDCGFSGITASGDDVGYEAAGFTFDAYEEFVDEVCNGEDPIGLDRDDYMALCYSAMNDCFIDGDGHVDYDNEAFRALAEYARDLPQEGSDHDQCDICGRAVMGVGYVTINSLRDYLCAFGGTSAATRLMGIPSHDGRGPVICVTDSVGISANAADIGICEQFVQYLLSYDAQTVFATAGFTPVNIAAFEDGSQDVIDEYNEQIEYLLQFSTREEIARCGFFAETVDRSVIEAYEGFITSSCTITRADPSIVVIVREEMPAYFSGQKSLDEVIEILQDRVQTFVNERG